MRGKTDVWAVHPVCETEKESLVIYEKDICFSSFAAYAVFHKRYL